MIKKAQLLNPWEVRPLKKRKSAMAKGRVVEKVWKTNPTDTFFWVQLEGVAAPYKVYYGCEGWNVDFNKKETRARYAVNRDVEGGRRVIMCIDISGPMEEILAFIECGSSNRIVRAEYIRAPRKVREEMAKRLPPLLQQQLGEAQRG